LSFEAEEYRLVKNKGGGRRVSSFGVKVKKRKQEQGSIRS
jgi:hypothetical protein